MIDKPYTVIRTCPTCHGHKYVSQAYCSSCEQEISADDAWWESGEAVLPCGHQETMLRLQKVCETCAGNGRISQSLTPSEWQTYQHHRRFRRVFVIALTLILLFVITYFIVSEPDYLCPSIWYGLIPLGLALKSISQ